MPARIITVQVSPDLLRRVESSMRVAPTCSTTRRPEPRCVTTPRLLVGGVSWRCGHLGAGEAQVLCRANKMRLPR